MSKLGVNERDTLVKQQFIEGINPSLKKDLLQQPKLSYGETASTAQKLYLAIKFSSNNTESQINRVRFNNTDDSKHGNSDQESQPGVGQHDRA